MNGVEVDWDRLNSEALAAEGLARLALDVGFDRLHMGDERSDAEVFVRPEEVRADTLAMVVGASMAIDLREMERQERESLIPSWRAGAEEARAEREEYGDDQEETSSDSAVGGWIGSRVPGTHGYLADGLPWAVAFVEVNADLIDELARHVLDVRTLTPMQVEEFAGDRLLFPDREQEAAARTALEPFLADLLAIDVAVRWIEKREHTIA